MESLSVPLVLSIFIAIMACWLMTRTIYSCLSDLRKFLIETLYDIIKHQREQEIQLYHISETLSKNLPNDGLENISKTIKVDLENDEAIEKMIFSIRDRSSSRQA